jgi:hypothetical protein
MVAPRLMGVTIYYGTCQDGPWNGKQMAHAVDIYRVAIDRHTEKAAPGLMTAPENEYKFGQYRWEGAMWVWSWHA